MPVGKFGNTPSGHTGSQGALRDSPERYRDAFEDAAMGAAVVGLDGQWLQVNRALCDMLGYSRDDLLARTFQEITHAEDLDLDLVNVRRMLAGEIATYQMEKRYLHRNGRSVWAMLSVSLVRDGDGQPQYFIAHIDDTTVRKEAEAGMRRAHARQQAVIAMQRDIATADLDIDIVMNTIIQQTRELVQAEVAGVGLVDGDDLVYRAITVPSALGIRVKIDASLSGLAVRTSELLVTGNTDDDPRVDPSAVDMVGVKSIIAIPLRHRGATIGALAVSSPRFHAFSDRDVEVMQLVATQLSAAMSHAAQREAEQALAVARSEALEQIQSSERRLQASEERFRTMVERAPVGVSVLTEQGIFEQVNEAFADLLGYLPHQLHGRHYSLVVPENRLGQTAILHRERLASPGESVSEVELLRKDGSRITALSRSIPLTDVNSVTRRVSFVVDITGRKKAEVQLQHLAHHDALTGLPNRTLLYDRLHHVLTVAKRRSEMVAVLFIDLDGFKAVNDREGHEAGDQLLREFANRLRRSVRESDTVARLAGDEFVLVLGNVGSANNVATVCSKLLDSLNTSSGDPTTAAGVTASIGVSLYPEHGSTGTDLIARADASMYCAKKQGKGRYSFYRAESVDLGAFLTGTG